MSSTSTTWTTQGNTKAGATSTSTDSLTTGPLVADTLQLSSNVIKASDGGSTITLDTSDNVTVLGDLIVTGGKITFGNSEFISNEVDGVTQIGSAASAAHYFIVSSSNNYDSSIAFSSNLVRWRVGYDASDTTDHPLLFNQGTGILGANTMMKLASDGDLTIAGDLAITGGNITTATTFDSTITVGVDGTGHDVKFFGDTASNYMLYDQSDDMLKIFTTGSSSGSGSVKLIHTDTDALAGPKLIMRRIANDALNDVIGNVTFSADDELSVHFTRVGDKGDTGSTGSTGNSGVSGIAMTWNSSTSDADPGAGKIAFNHATLASVSVLYVDDADDASADITSWVQSWDDATNTVSKGFVKIEKEGAASTYALYKVNGSITDASGYTKVPVAHVVSAGSFSNTDGVGVSFTQSGTDGAMTSFTVAGSSGSSQTITNGRPSLATTSRVGNS